MPCTHMGPPGSRKYPRAGLASLWPAADRFWASSGHAAAPTRPILYGNGGTTMGCSAGDGSCGGVAYAMHTNTHYPQGDSQTEFYRCPEMDSKKPWTGQQACCISSSNYATIPAHHTHTHIKHNTHTAGCLLHCGCCPLPAVWPPHDRPHDQACPTHVESQAAPLLEPPFMGQLFPHAAQCQRVAGHTARTVGGAVGPTARVFGSTGDLIAADHRHPAALHADQAHKLIVSLSFSVHIPCNNGFLHQPSCFCFG